jgi:hypothetical protein
MDQSCPVDHHLLSTKIDFDCFVFKESRLAIFASHCRADREEPSVPTF